MTKLEANNPIIIQTNDGFNNSDILKKIKSEHLKQRIIVIFGAILWGIIINFEPLILKLLDKYY